MGKKVIISLLTVVFIICSLGAALAGEEGNARKGKYAYRNVYMACHLRGAVDSPKPALSPDSKTQAQWKRIFDEKKFEEFGCKEEWSKLSEQDLLDIHAYLFEHAADSPSPAKCK
jgi:hypothetical protein